MGFSVKVWRRAHDTIETVRYEHSYMAEESKLP